MQNRGGMKSGCKGWLLRNSRDNSGVPVLWTKSGRMSRIQTLQLNSVCMGGIGRSDNVFRISRTQGGAH